MACRWHIEKSHLEQSHSTGKAPPAEQGRKEQANGEVDLQKTSGNRTARKDLDFTYRNDRYIKKN